MYSAPSELFSYSLMVENTDSTRQEKTSRNLRTEVEGRPHQPAASLEAEAVGPGPKPGHAPPSSPAPICLINGDSLCFGKVPRRLKDREQAAPPAQLGKWELRPRRPLRRQVALHTHLSHLCPLQAEAALLSPYQD